MERQMFNKSIFLHSKEITAPFLAGKNREVKTTKKGYKR